MLRTFFRLLILVLLATPFASAQPLPDRAPLSGLALDSAGKPLPGALITLRRQETTGAFAFWGAVALSDARGAWRFAQAEVGRYYLSAEAPGYAPLSNRIVEWKTGAAPLRLRFERLVTLRLKILAPDGSPVIKAPLWLRLRGQGNAGQVTRRAASDQNGSAEFGELLPSNYALFLAAPGGFAIQNGLALSSDKTLDLNLQRGGTLSISAIQAGENARALGGAVLNLMPENSVEATRALGSSADWNENVALLAARGDQTALISRDGDGQIEIADLPPGRYSARLRLPGYEAASQIIQIEAGQTTPLQFVLTPGAAANVAALKLDLRFKDAGGNQKSAPAQEWSLRVLPIDFNGVLAPEAREEGAFLPGGSNIARRALSDSNGQIALFPLKVGRYRIFVAPRTPPGAENPPEAASLDVDVPVGGATASLILPVSLLPPSP